MRFTLAVLLVVWALLLAACSSIPSQSNLSPEQITAFAKDKSISAVCTIVPTPWGVTNIKMLSVDQSVLHNGKVVIADGCGITMEETAKPPSVAPTPAATGVPK